MKSHLHALHYVYLPRINAALAEFKVSGTTIELDQWKTNPLALWYSNIQNGPEDPIAISETSYGIDYFGPLPETTTDNNIVVHLSDLELTEAQVSYLQEHVDPLLDHGNNGIEHYLNILDILKNF